MRNRVDEQLEKLNGELTQMGKLCEEAISSAVAAFLSSDGDEALIQQALETDSEIDKKERDIEAMCMRLLLSQQPVARDLRTVSSALKMISDMERIGDQASDIAEITRSMTPSTIKNEVHVKNMTEAAIKMVTDSIESFVKKDLALAQEVIAYDDVVDRMFDTIKCELIELISKQNVNGELCIDLLMIAKYLERIGDHATNIAEWVIYSITGLHNGE